MQNEPHISLQKSSTILYGILLGIGIAIILLFHTSRFDLVHESLEKNLQHGLVGLAAGGILLLSSEFLNSSFASYRELRRQLENIMGRTSLIGGLYLALLSGLSEEVFFRGAIQPWLGLLPTSIIFGLLHLGPRGRISLWTLWAIASGFIIGWIFERTGTLVAPIIAHVFVNTVSIQRLRRSYAKRLDTGPTYKDL